MPSVMPSVFTGPLMAMVVLGLLGFGLRWTFGTTASAPGPNSTGEGDGLLAEVSVLPSPELAAVLRGRLLEAGVRATTSRRTGGGWAVLVFPRDEAAARTVLSRHSLG